MTNLDRLIREARRSDLGWSPDREDRVRASTLRRHESRLARGRLARRAVGLASATAIITFFFLRGTASSASPLADAPSSSVVASEALANGDGGYSHD